MAKQPVIEALTQESVKLGIDSIRKRERLLGRKDVVEWIMHPSHQDSYQSGTYHFYRFSAAGLEAKLKEWGLWKRI